MLRALRAYPTLLRVGIADMIAYRTEFLIWALTTNMPLVMLAVWNAAVDDGPVGRFGRPQFIAYYLITMIVRLLVSNWVVWEITMSIRHGTLATRLMRPLHPLWAWSAEQLAAVPMRLVLVAPVVVALVHAAGSELTRDPALLAIFALSLVGAWLVQFFLMVALGLASFWIESSFGLFEVWMGVNAVLGGYLVPLELLPEWLRSSTGWLPFRFLLSFPVETAMGLHPVDVALGDLGIQWAYVAVSAAATLALWRAGLRRFAAFGG
ncbi:MAG: ABC-2 family transporter protein [Deltaproteobacteria bacterium]|nr:ABC-2 family transporter protein [Deltaproteobacteria bacterium]